MSVLSKIIIILIFTHINIIAQTKEKFDIDSKAKQLDITTTELQEILFSNLRIGESVDLQPDTLTIITITGEAASDHFGNSVSTAGDVNGDGYSDVIVGAPGNDVGGTQAGRAYIYFGGTLMDDIADVTMTGEAGLFGNSVSTAGDVNGDGYNDVIVGTQNDRAYIYFGGTSMDNIADVTMAGEEDEYFGYSVSTAGDVNGDGYSDVIVGAYYNDSVGPQAGRAYIYFGGASMDSTIDVTMTGEATGDGFGNSVSAAEDINADGYSDVIIGAWGYDDVGYEEGRAYIYFGSTSMDNIADVTMTGEAPGDNFGNSVSTAGDVNGDGYSNVIVGAFYNAAGGTNAGRAYIYFLDQSGTYVEVGVNIIDNYSLDQNYPNPFNPSTKIRYSVAQSSNVVIKVFDILGNEIETLANEVKPIGTYEITWYAENLPSGIYFYQLRAGDFIEAKKMVLLR